MSTQKKRSPKNKRPEANARIITANIFAGQLEAGNARSG
jgi:hypothetical protein